MDVLQSIFNVAYEFLKPQKTLQKLDILLLAAADSQPDEKLKDVLTDIEACEAILKKSKSRIQLKLSQEAPPPASASTQEPNEATVESEKPKTRKKRGRPSKAEQTG